MPNVLLSDLEAVDVNGLPRGRGFCKDIATGNLLWDDGETIKPATGMHVFQNLAEAGSAANWYAKYQDAPIIINRTIYVSDGTSWVSGLKKDTKKITAITRFDATPTFATGSNGLFMPQTGDDATGNYPVTAGGGASVATATYDIANVPPRSQQSIKMVVSGTGSSNSLMTVDIRKLLDYPSGGSAIYGGWDTSSVKYLHVLAYLPHGTDNNGSINFYLSSTDASSTPFGAGKYITATTINQSSFPNTGWQWITVGINATPKKGGWVFANPGASYDKTNVRTLGIKITSASGQPYTISIAGVYFDIQDGAKFAISFDDIYENAFIAGKPILDSAGLKASWYSCQSTIGVQGYLSNKQLDQLNAEGHMIGNHVVSHATNLDCIPPECVTYQAIKQKNYLQARGWYRGANHLAYVGSANTLTKPTSPVYPTISWTVTGGVISSASISAAGSAMNPGTYFVKPTDATGSGAVVSVTCTGSANAATAVNIRVLDGGKNYTGPSGFKMYDGLKQPTITWNVVGGVIQQSGHTISDGGDGMPMGGAPITLTASAGTGAIIIGYPSIPGGPITLVSVLNGGSAYSGITATTVNTGFSQPSKSLKDAVAAAGMLTAVTVGNQNECHPQIDTDNLAINRVLMANGVNAANSLQSILDTIDATKDQGGLLILYGHQLDATNSGASTLFNVSSFQAVVNKIGVYVADGSAENFTLDDLYVDKLINFS